MKKNRWMPYFMIGVVLLVMAGLMGAFSFMFSDTYPMQLIFSSGSSGSSEMWRLMIIPLLGLLVMGVMMFFVLRSMTSGKGIMSMILGQNHQSEVKELPGDLTIMTFNVPGVNCAHCKMKIEGDLGKLPGVASVNVDIEAKQVHLELITPPTREKIEGLLTDIGYPPQD